MATWKLTIEDDEGQKTVVPLVRDDYTVGRGEAHAVRLTERNVSRDHARLRRDGESYFLEDLGSYNGVFVNGHRLSEPRKLASGDLILIGDYRIEAHDDDVITSVLPIVAAATVPQPVFATSASLPATTVPSIGDTPRARMVQLSGDDAGRESPIERDRSMLGRGDDAAVRVNHASVSRHHCELRLLEDGRVEIIDQGSANGLRLNGRETSKGLLMPGEVFEVGDVVMKYVPAGEAFVFDAAAMEVARGLLARAKAKETRGSPIAWAVAIVVIGAAATGGVMLARQGRTEETTSPVRSTSSGLSAATLDAIDRATQKLESGDVESAHALVKDLGDTARLRTDKRYANVEDSWAKKRITALSGEADATKRAAGLQEIFGSGASESLRDQAEALLSAAAADAGAASSATAPSSDPIELPSSVPDDSHVDAGAIPTPHAPISPTPPSPTTNPTSTTAPAPTTPPTTAPTPITTPTPTGCASFRGDYVAATKAHEYTCVRQMLMPSLNSGAISPTQARHLKAACVSLGDQTCAQKAALKI